MVVPLSGGAFEKRRQCRDKHHGAYGVDLKRVSKPVAVHGSQGSLRAWGILAVSQYPRNVEQQVHALSCRGQAENRGGAKGKSRERQENHLLSYLYVPCCLCMCRESVKLRFAEHPLGILPRRRTPVPTAAARCGASAPSSWALL